MLCGVFHHVGDPFPEDRVAEGIDGVVAGQEVSNGDGGLGVIEPDRVVSKAMTSSPCAGCLLKRTVFFPDRSISAWEIIRICRT